MEKGIFLSIYPKHMEQIKKKVKNFEFRPFEINPVSDLLTFWIYETKPTMALKYKMKVKAAISLLPDSVHFGLGDDKFYDQIAKGKKGYEIIHLSEFVKPISLEKLRSFGVSAPQNYAYIKKYPKLLQSLEKSEYINYY